MKLEQSFEVQAPIEQVWSALNDLERVAPCLPGASITGHDDDGTYHGTFQVKLGPATASYRGTIKIEEADESAHRATLKARGTDKRGQGGASATIVNTLASIEGGTRVEAVTDFSITGRLAAFGRGGMMQDISNRLMRDFATCLQSRLAEGPPAAAPTGAEVTAGDAAPESVVAAAPVEGTAPGATTTPAAEAPPAAPAADASSAADSPAADDEAPPAADAPLAADAPASAASPPMGGGPHAARAGGPSAPPPPVAPSSTPAPSAPVAPPAAPVKGFSLVFSILWERIKGLFRRSG